MEVYSAISLFSGVLTLLYLTVVAAFIIGWKRLQSFIAYPKAPNTRVSVVVSARDEGANIRRTLECLVAQDYPAPLREIIFVDDHSTDDTAEIIRSYEKQGVRLIQLREHGELNSYKKKAIETAIAAADGDLIVTTDADCVMEKGWIGVIVAYYEETGCKMISSPVQFFEEKNLFERCQALEFLYLIGMGASTIGIGRPTTCNGANLAYERRVFHEVGGFKGIDDLASGDDELLLHKIAARYPDKICFLKDPAATVYTHAKPDLAALISQRKRWASKSTRYKNKSIVWLGLAIWFFNLSILVNIVAGAYDLRYLTSAVLQLVFKMAVEFLYLKSITKFAGRRQLLSLLPLVSLTHVIYIIYIGIAGNSGKYQWKGRRVH